MLWLLARTTSTLDQVRTTLSSLSMAVRSRGIHKSSDTIFDELCSLTDMRATVAGQLSTNRPTTMEEILPGSAVLIDR
jgi:hypothetical protein